MIRFVAFLCVWMSMQATAETTTEFCLDGELDLGARYQGSSPAPGETYPTSWCVITDSHSHRVKFSADGKSNPDMDDKWAVAYLPPDMVRIVNSDAAPDVEFRGTDNVDEALRVRRLDPQRLLEEFRASPENLQDIQIDIRDDRLVSVTMSAELPLRGRVPVVWNWQWADAARPSLRLMLDNTLLLKATGRWRNVPPAEAAALWKPTPGADPVQVPGDRWPAKIDLQRVDLTDGVYMVTGVRTGFQHLVVDTDEGLIIADAPAGWVEFHQIPPSDLVPGLGISGLSEKFVDFLHREFPKRPIRAVALTHFHDDHAGGARAFAAAGAEIFAPRKSSNFLERALNRSSMPNDRLSGKKKHVAVSPVDEQIVIGGQPNRVKLLSIGSGPHADAMLGLLAVDKNYFFVSDVHVPRSRADTPRENRAITECWFAQWAVANLAPKVLVVNSHSTIATPVFRLRQYLGSETCVAENGGT